ncbi:MAG: hypothetical protein V1934_00260 [Methanobacteriota archaeon]
MAEKEKTVIAVEENVAANQAEADKKLAKKTARSRQRSTRTRPSRGRR